MSPVHCKLSMSSARCPGPVGSSSSTSVEAIPIPNENVHLALRSRISPICSYVKSVTSAAGENRCGSSVSHLFICITSTAYCIVHICDKKQANRPSSFAVHCQFKWVRGVPNLPRATGWQKKPRDWTASIIGAALSLLVFIVHSCCLICVLL